MGANNDSIKIFQTRVRQLILQYQQVKKENEELYALVEDNENRIKQLEDELASEQQNYKALKTARMLEVSGQDVESAKEILAKLIRDVDKCINLLRE